MLRVFPNKNTSKTFSGGTCFLKNKNTQKTFLLFFLFPNKTLAPNNKHLFQTFCVALFSFVESELSSLQRCANDLLMTSKRANDYS